MSSRPQSARAKYENYDLQADQPESALVLAPGTPPPAPRAAPSGDKGGNSHIDIFVRIKPQPRASQRLSYDATEGKVEFNLPREAAAGYVNNQREHYEFRFNGILGPEAKQDEVFERVARGVVTGALEGYNGTIFAYGQTGSGKTFTITGGPSAYADRGIIPRTISTVFNEVTKRSDHQFAVHVSYLEIYNEIGYDLLDPNREVTAMEDLPQVHILEDEEGKTGFRNLNIHRANNEEEALNLLFLGDTNRTISETPMNQASSRSHCIFTIYIEARKHGEEVVRRSKLNLVDLAGSERASKTGIDGTTLREAKYINLSLHYLEQVIIALQERSMGMNRPHVPYRNSKMTQVLRDSLGGNCRTIMIATVSADQGQLDESISTCRFAMRVALVRNVVAVNEEVDPTLVIRRLKQEIRELKEEIRLLRGGGAEEDRGPLTPDELSRLQEQIDAYCADTSPEASLNLGGSVIFIRAAFSLFKQMAVSGGLKKRTGDSNGASDTDLSDQIKKLKLQIAQRDNEINILVGMIKRRDGNTGPAAAAAAASSGVPALPAPATSATTTTTVPKLAWGASSPQPHTNTQAPLTTSQYNSNSTLAPASPSQMQSQPSLTNAFNPGTTQQGSTSSLLTVASSGGGVQASGGGFGGAGVGGAMQSTGVGIGGGHSGGVQANGGGGQGGGSESLLDAALLADRNQAFELFRKSYRQNEVIEQNKAALKAKYDQAKTASALVNGCKERINDLKALIEQRRLQRTVTQGPDAVTESDPEEERCKAAIEKEKAQYKVAFEDLRGCKKEIEHLHMLLEQSRVRLQKDFDQWMALMARQQTTASTSPLGTHTDTPTHTNSYPHTNPHSHSSPQYTSAASPSHTHTPLTHSHSQQYQPSPQQYNQQQHSAGTSPGTAGRLQTSMSGLSLSGLSPQGGNGAHGGGGLGAWDGGRSMQGALSPGVVGGGGMQYGLGGGVKRVQSQTAQGLVPGGGAGPGGGATPRDKSSQQSLISARSAPVPSDSPSQAAVSKQAWAEPASLSTTPTHTGSTAAAPGTLDFSSVDPQVLAAAQPYLTGNAEADQDILKFYIARQQLLSKLQASGTGPAVA